jgi:hypothetical protein
MKQLLKKIFIFGTLGLAIAIVATQVSAAPFVPTNNANPEPLKFLNVSSTNQSKQGWLGLGSAGTYNPLAVLDVKNTTFADALAVIGKAWFSGNLLVGYPSIPSVITNKLMVDQGYIRSTALTGTGDRPACSDANGKLIACTNNANGGGIIGTPQVVSTSPLCGSAANAFAVSTPTSNFCGANAYLYSSISTGSNGAYTWSCYSYSGGFTTATCSTSPLPPTCGDSAYIAHTSTPTANLCYAGTATATPTPGSGGTYSWSCSDTYGNPPAPCTSPSPTPTPTTPANCFALRSATGFTLSCAQGSSSATKYRVQALLPPQMTAYGDPSIGNSYVEIPAVNAKFTAAGLGGWVKSLVMTLPQAIFINGDLIQPAGDPTTYIWRIQACNNSTCSGYSNLVTPGPFYGSNDASGSGDYGAFPLVVTKSWQSGKLALSWPVVLTQGVQNNLYPTVYIYKCDNPSCMVFGGGISAGFSQEPVDINSTPNMVPHGPVTCTTTTCTVLSTTASSNWPLSEGYMITLGKDTYNDAKIGPKETAANTQLTGYISGWDQFSPWMIAQ